jgi:hypothetical protein
MTVPYLYHGTCSRHARAVLKRGLHPRGKKPSLWEAHPSRADHVYLTQAYASFFARQAVQPGYQMAIFRIAVEDLDPARLFADEDALESANRYKDTAHMPTLFERTAHYRDLWEIIPEARKWEASLDYLGNCSHNGPIMPDAIDAIALIKRQSALSWMSDPTITRANYSLLGPYYRALTAWPFEGETAVAREKGKSGISDTYMEKLERTPSPFENDYRVFYRPIDGWKAGLPGILKHCEKQRRKDGRHGTQPPSPLHSDGGR